METTTNKKGRLPLKETWKLHKEKYLLIIPFAIIFVIFNLVPVLVAMGLSFTSFNMLEAPDFVGLANYIELLARDEVFLIAVKNTLLLAFITGPVSYLMCFIFAWLINELPPKPRAILTLIFYAPSISGNVYLIWKLIFSSDMYGFANAWLMKFGIIDSPILWFENADYILPILIVVQLWLSLGVSFLAFIAGLQTVDKSLYEAGSMDGIKNRWQ
ncbi:MAG: sugar ABC transporter permease [Niameybacter sp.]